MRVHSIELVEFRNYTHFKLVFDGLLTAIIGANGQGKTNLLEAVALMSGVGSIRCAPAAALVREGSDSAKARCCVHADNGREIVTDLHITRHGRSQFHVNSQRVSRQSDLMEYLTVTVFSPDDLALVKGGPALRRNWIDDALAATKPAFTALRNEFERVLKQRNALLRQVGSKLDVEVSHTLDVWDSKFAETGEALRKLRLGIISSLLPRLTADYEQVSCNAHAVDIHYESSWGDENLLDAIKAARRDDLRRSVTTVGPQRDDLLFTIDLRPARTHASQGEQRSLALAMRLAVDAEVRKSRGIRPVLLLDDVFSELDPARVEALFEVLPDGQRLFTTSAILPDKALPDQVVRIAEGKHLL